MSALPRPSRILVVASLLVSAGLLDRVDTGAEEEITAQISDGADRIQPGSNHPTYWRYEGEPVQLVDGSGEDHLFQGEGDQFREHLDRLAEVGGNYIRNTMSSRDEDNVWPFYRREDRCSTFTQE